MTSFGSPGGRQVVHKPIPPQRGSFPLDHDGECKHIMSAYLRCIRQQRGLNAPECRAYSKQYLSCRMDNNLMAPDDFSNLGFASTGPAAVPNLPDVQARSDGSGTTSGRASASTALTSSSSSSPASAPSSASASSPSVTATASHSTIPNTPNGLDASTTQAQA